MPEAASRAAVKRRKPEVGAARVSDLMNLNLPEVRLTLLVCFTATEEEAAACC